MANPTSNFGWQMPTPTDLVTDLPADFEVFGQAVDTSLADLKGGTSGQILAKNSNTDMDFVWITNDVGDITAITASSPLTGGGTSGDVTVGIQDATTAQKGAVQLENSTSSTSTTTAAVPASVKSAYDLANAAIPKSLIDAAGDLIVGTAADTAGRLGIGTAGQVLKVNSGATALEWGAAGTSFVGCAIYNAGGSVTYSSNTSLTLNFSSEDYDTNGFHDNTTNNTRITIPSGYAGKYLINQTWRLGVGVGNYVLARCLKNGGNINLGIEGTEIARFANLGGNSFCLNASVVLNLAVGDYIEMQVQSDYAGSAATYARFSASYLGA